MITLSNGHAFEFMTASGALAFDGQGWPWEWPLRWAGLLDPSLFTIVIKTLTRYPRRGNLRWSHPWSVVKNRRAGGVVNAIGLTNQGIEWWIEKVAPKIPRHYKMIVSLEADNEQDVVAMIQRLEGQKIFGIELNLSCPNTPSSDHRTSEKILSICRMAKEHSKYPLLAKLSFTHDYRTLSKELEGMAQAIAINSIPWQSIYPGTPSPLAHYGGGGVSGRVIQSMTWKMVEEIATISSVPVIGPSVWNYEDVEKIVQHGAKAVSFGSVFVRYPWRPTLFVRRWRREHS